MAALRTFTVAVIGHQQLCSTTVVGHGVSADRLSWSRACAKNNPRPYECIQPLRSVQVVAHRTAMALYDLTTCAGCHAKLYPGTSYVMLRYAKSDFHVVLPTDSLWTQPDKLGYCYVHTNCFFASDISKLYTNEQVQTMYILYGETN